VRGCHVRVAEPWCGEKAERPWCSELGLCGEWRRRKGLRAMVWGGLSAVVL
jgi:hypothetical protein